MSFSDYKNKTKEQKHQLEAENKRREEEEALAANMIYADERGLPWPPEEHEEEWTADRQYWIDEAFKAIDKVFKPMPDKPALKKPPPLDWEAAREAAKKIMETEDAFEQYEKKQ